MNKKIFFKILISSIIVLNTIMPFNISVANSKNIEITVNPDDTNNLGINIDGVFRVNEEISSGMVIYSISKNPDDYATKTVFNEELNTNGKESSGIWSYSFGQKLYQYSNGGNDLLGVVKGDKYYATVIIITSATSQHSEYKYVSNTVLFTAGTPSETPPLGGGQIEDEPIDIETRNNIGNVNLNEYQPLAPIPGFTDETVSTNNIGQYFNVIFKFAIGLAGALAVIMIIIGGIQYMGDESIFGKTEAKKRIFSAILGLLIALGSWAILNTIDPNLLGTKGLKVKQVSFEIVNLPDAGDNTIDPDFNTGSGSYSVGTVSPSVANAVTKLKQGWEIDAFRVYPSNNRMVISLKKGSEVDNTNLITISPGENGYAEIGKGVVRDGKTPKGEWKILSIRKSKDNQPVYSAEGANMGATFWLLSPTNNGERGIGMHGNKNGTLGETAGCLRLTNADLLALLPYVKTGISVNIKD
ncbi:TPA: hypothetical protein DIC38_00795 [Candidatus Nomurabacteria bacterium]|nr:MAG: hypothetical protein O210_OD1C00001G0568 [Parcubacteria bacterium RAAC4_OD1_1]HCY26209.1 hypothetical protein [Candidatus Nomurabacteria bacterium]